MQKFVIANYEVMARYNLFLLIISVVGSLNAHEYIAVGVSGGLQDGFPDHEKMDFRRDDEYWPAVFLGRALIRGYKSFLDVMEPNWRQYAPGPQQPLINCNVIPSGCWNHANEYWIYLVGSRQFITLLMNEPRFLSITPDLGLCDLEAEETGSVVKLLALHEIQWQNKTDTSHVAFPIVTAAWYNPSSHVPSPIMYTKKDGTQVTNFPHSLAIWAGIENDTCDVSGSNASVESYQHHQQRDYWDKIRQAIRTAEKHRLASVEAASNGPPFECARKARFGVTPEMARINYAMDPEKIRAILQNGGYSIDFHRAIVSANQHEKLNYR
jgi:hypothetical protein